MTRLTRPLPVWAEAVGDRLAFYAEQRGDAAGAAEAKAVLAALANRAAGPGGDERTMMAFLEACLDLFEETVAAPAFEAGRAGLLALSAMARSEIAGGRDDRGILAREDALMGLPEPICFAAGVPGRVVFLAAMARHVPGEIAPAATMLVNDLAATGRDLPLRALRIAAGA